MPLLVFENQTLETKYFDFFYFSDNRLPDVSKRDEREKKQIDIERERATKWANMMNRDKIRKFFEPQAKYREKMITRIYKGVPDMVRGQLWYILLDIEKIKEEQSGIYAKMRDIARRHSPDIRQVTNNFILLCIFIFQ